MPEIKYPKRRSRGKVSNRVAIAIWHRDGGVCQVCQKPIKPHQVTFDHIEPCNSGGTTEMSNLQLAHEQCNADRNRKQHTELRASILDELEAKGALLPDLGNGPARWRYDLGRGFYKEQ